MKKLIVSTIIFICTLQIVNSQSGWVWQNPLPQGNSLNSLKFFNLNTGIAVGATGSILKTTNSGFNWHFKRINDLDKINSNAIIDSLSCVAVGTNGTILLSQNRGDNWLVIESGTTYNLSSVTFVNNMIGYTTGFNKFLKTTNGGINWFSPSQIPNKNYSGVFFIDISTGWITSSYWQFPNVINDVSITTNGGLNWNVQTYSTSYGSATYNSICFINQYTGWCNPNLKTTNGGINWLYDSLTFDKIYFYNYKFGWKWSFLNEVIYKTTNSGMNWMPSNNFSNNIYSLNFSDSVNGYGVGKYGLMIRTTNGGANWNVQSSGIKENVKVLHILDSNNLWAGCDSGIILRTTNSGINWLQHYIGENSNIRDISFPSVNTGFIVTSNYKVLKTTNGGINWISTSYNGTLANCLFFINNNTGWVGIYKTTNGGFNWDRMSVDYPSDIYFFNHSTGWISSYHLYKTIDGGNTWIRKFYNTLGGGFSKLHFINEKHGWAAFADYHIYKTNDSGNTWISYSIPQSSSSLLYFKDTLNGIVSPHYLMGLSFLTKTNDGGNNWFNIFSVSNEHWWYDLKFTNERTCWIVGFGGAIIKNNNFNWEPLGIITNNSEIPNNFSLSQNYPNPFNPTTKIKFSLPNHSKGGTQEVKLIIYNILGREVSTLVNEALKPGTYEIDFDGSGFASGVYFYKLFSDEFIETKRMVLIK